MWNLFYNLIKDFGAMSLNLVQLFLICYFGWKLFTNHLKHIQMSLDANQSEIKCVKDEVINLKERISKVEGKLD